MTSRSTVLPVRNPGTGEHLGEIEDTTPDQIEEAVRRAREGARAMAALPAHERARLLHAVAAAIEAELAPLARLLAAENGKPLAQTVEEVRAAARIFRGYAGEATRLLGRQIPLDAVPGLEHHLAVTRRVPLGVVAALVPFNYPVELYAHKAAAALAAGNAVLVHPPVRCPLALLRVTALVEAAGFPPHAHQTVTGGVHVSQALASLPGVDAVSLTGSTAAGREIARRAADTLKRVHLELGGNDALFVCADADVEAAAEAVVLGRLARGNGQICCAVKRVYVDRAVHADFTEALLAKAGGLTVGDQLADGTDIGPLITAEAAARVGEAVDALVADGARLALGGKREGAFHGPAVLLDVPEDSPTLREEIFGPVAPVAVFDDPFAAVRLANESPYGLQAAVFTRDVERALRLADALDVGGVVVNGSTALRAENLPFGGPRDTGGSAEGLHDTAREFSREKTVILTGALG